MDRPRNTQRAKFWRAQAVLSEVSRPFKTERGVKRFVINARERAFLRRRYGEFLTRDIMVKFEGQPEAGRWIIVAPGTEWKEHSMCRLIARVIWHRKQPYHCPLAWHGIEYCAIYVDVVQAMMGRTSAELLKNSFRAHGVRFKPKKKVTVTEEMRERLAAARAKQGE